ncbi:MAG TPA: oligosaccharide flippase family protein [Chthoniobacterales bacterium]|nr:oligosaccharide flippase family protein [Chthoniobacterales bacterium]
MTSTAQRLILRGGSSAALGFLIRLGARLLFVFIAGRLFGVALFGAFSIALAVVELAVTIGGAGMKRQLFKLLDEGHHLRPPPHIVIDGIVLVFAASFLCAAPIMLAVALIPDSLIAANTATALFLLAPMILGQSLLDLLLAATRWTHKMRHQVWARSIIEPYAGVAASCLAWAAGYQATGLIIGYWAGTIAAVIYSLAGALRCLGPFSLGTYHLVPSRFAQVIRETTLPTLSDFTNALAGRLDLYLVGLFLGESAAGIYGMARQIRTPIRQVRQSFDSLLTPIVSKTLTLAGPIQTGKATASATRLILAIQLPVLVALFILGGPLLQLIGPAFAAGYWPMLILGAAESIQGAYGVSDLIFLYRRPQFILCLTAAGAAVNFAAAWALIAFYGVLGAALAALLGTLAAAFTRRWLLRSHFGIAVPLHHSAAPILAAAASVAVALPLMTLPLAAPIRFAVAVSAGLAIYWAVLHLVLRFTGESLALTDFVTHAAPVEP